MLVCRVFAILGLYLGFDCYYMDKSTSVDMASAGAWRFTVQQLHNWRPLCRYWPLRSDVRDRIRNLGCARRRCRAGWRSRGRANVNNNIAIRLPDIVGDRHQHEPHLCPLRLFESVSAIPVVVTDQRLSRVTRITVDRRPSALVHVQRTKRSPSVANIGQLNARSVCNKSAAINDLIIEHHLDLFAVVESWHDTDSPSLIAATPPGYRFVEKAGSLSQTNHGGICVFMRSHFIVCTVPLPSYDTVEVLLLTIRYGACNASLLTLYRPGSRPITDQFF